jgi:ABC-type spermidine/putrescine transport system permease subunit I
MNSAAHVSTHSGPPQQQQAQRPRLDLTALLSWKALVIGVCVAFTVYIAVVPLGFLLWQSFFTPQTATKAAEFTWGNYITAYTSSDTARLFWTSVQFAVGTAGFLRCR